MDFGRNRIIFDNFFGNTAVEIKLGEGFVPEQLERYARVYREQLKLSASFKGKVSISSEMKFIEDFHYVLIPNAKDLTLPPDQLVRLMEKRANEVLDAGKKLSKNMPLEVTYLDGFGNPVAMTRKP